MFEALLWAAAVIAIAGTLIALDSTKDVFHPLVFIGPMLAFLYAWMPTTLFQSGSLEQYFNIQQLAPVQLLNVLGILAFTFACLFASGRPRRKPATRDLSPISCHRLRIGATIIGGIGLTCWTISIVNVGGFVNAFSRSYSGGWDDSGYVRDGNLLLLVGLLLIIGAAASDGWRLSNVLLGSLFGVPWLTQAILMARRGPTFAFAVIFFMGSYLLRGKRPPLLAVGLGGLALGWLSLFLVTNRSNIYLGSDFSFKTDTADVQNIVEKSDTGNEYIYGSGSVIAAESRGHYFWMRRYLAQLIVRPIPSSIWPTKYEDFGVPELLNNAGTGDGISDTLGWVGAVGSAPGIIADLFIEAWWLGIVLMGAIGWGFGYVWRKAILGGPAWQCQYLILSALSMYLVMQTMEAVIFRSLLLSIPCWLVWKWALQPDAQLASELKSEIQRGESVFIENGSARHAY